MIYQIITLFNFAPRDRQYVGSNYEDKYKVGDESFWEFVKYYIAPAILGLQKSPDLELTLVETVDYSPKEVYPRVSWSYWEACINHNWEYKIGYEKKDAEKIKKDGGNILSLQFNNSIFPFVTLGRELYANQPTIIIYSDNIEIKSYEKNVFRQFKKIIPGAHFISNSTMYKYLINTLASRKDTHELINNFTLKSKNELFQRVSEKIVKHR